MGIRPLSALQKVRIVRVHPSVCADTASNGVDHLPIGRLTPLQLCGFAKVDENVEVTEVRTPADPCVNDRGHSAVSGNQCSSALYSNASAHMSILPAELKTNTAGILAFCASI